MSLITPGSLVFDIGAHHGESARAMLAAGAGKVVSVEPTFENFTELCKVSGIVPIHAALWNAPGLVEVSYAESQSGLSTVSPAHWREQYPDAVFRTPQTVPALTLAQLLHHFGTPSLIKVDVEGAEYDVLQAYPRVIPRPVIIFEYHWRFADTARACLNLLDELGYTLGAYTQSDVDYALTVDQPLDSAQRDWEAAAPEWGNFYVR